MKICKVFVDRIPENCGQCALMGYINDDYPVCYGIANPVIREIAGNPYDMKYRRSDCPLETHTDTVAVSALGVLR